MLRAFYDLVRAVRAIESRIERMQVALGRLEGRSLDAAREERFTEREFGVFSQWGEDGLLQFLVSRVPIPPESRVFVEFGVETYVESNTRFLLVGGGWSGLVMDGSEEHIATIRADAISWRHSLDAKAAFVTAENASKLIAESGIAGDIGILSIDVDGNDYWIWRALTGISPRIVVVEYNSLFGPSRAVTVPYDAAFERTRAHHSNLYYGASITALARLGAQKGYVLVGSNRAGNNLFFVRSDVASALVPVSPADAWVRAGFREARDERGALTFASFAERRRAIEHLPVVDLETGQETSIAEIG